MAQFLRNISAEMVLTNHFHISRLREVFAKSVKNDEIDRYVIAQALRMNVLKDSQKEDEYIFLQDLLERHYDLVDRKTMMACGEGSGWKTSKLHKTIIKSQARELKMIIDEIKIIQEALDYLIFTR